MISKYNTHATIICQRLLLRNLLTDFRQSELIKESISSATISELLRSDVYFVLTSKNVLLCFKENFNMKSKREIRHINIFSVLLRITESTIRLRVTEITYLDKVYKVHKVSNLITNYCSVLSYFALNRKGACSLRAIYFKVKTIQFRLIRF